MKWIGYKQYSTYFDGKVGLYGLKWRYLWNGTAWNYDTARFTTRYRASQAIKQGDV